MELKEAKFRWTLLTQKARRKHLHIPVRELQERDEWKALTQCTIEWCVMVHDAPGERSNADEAYDLQEAWQKALCGALHHDELNEALFYRWGQRELSELQVLYSDGWTEMSLEQAYLEIVEAMGLPQLQDEWDQAANIYRKLEAEEDRPQPHRPIYKPLARGGQVRKGLIAVETSYTQQKDYAALIATLKIDYANHSPAFPMYQWPRSRKCYLVLHLFSGRRRHGDFHDHLQRMAVGKDYDIRVFSMDLAVDEEYGDLWPTSTAWRKVRDGLRKGIFCCRAGR